MGGCKDFPASEPLSHFPDRGGHTPERFGEEWHLVSLITPPPPRAESASLSHRSAQRPSPFDGGTAADLNRVPSYAACRLRERRREHATAVGHGETPPELGG